MNRAEWVSAQLDAQRNPVDAAAMQAYLKSEIPFYGVKSPGRSAILREMVKLYPVGDAVSYREAVLGLWKRPHREEKYLALGVARHSRAFITMQHIPLYRRLVVEGAWWDFVDEIASHLVGEVLLRQRAELSPLLDEWINDDDMWIRRTAILSQLRHKEETDVERLFQYCLLRSHEKEFFIRKAIGWALRQYSKIDPDAVRTFVDQHEDQLSGLSKREARKYV